MKTTADVLGTLDNKMGMITRDQLSDWLQTDESVDIIDLRSPEAWSDSHIRGSRQVKIQELPARFSEILPDKKNNIVCVCNGSVQSAMALVFLRSEGYENCFNLSGGFSGWAKAELPVDSTEKC